YLEGHTSVARFKCGRGGRRNRKIPGASTAGTERAGDRVENCRTRIAEVASNRLRNLWWLKLRRITKLPHDLDHGALSTLGRNARRGQQIHAFLLIQRTDDNLKLWIGKHTSQPKNSWRHAGRAHRREKQRINRIRADGKISAPVTS